LCRSAAKPTKAANRVPRKSCIHYHWLGLITKIAVMVGRIMRSQDIKVEAIFKIFLSKSPGITEMH
jgi:hypothetical protein